VGILRRRRAGSPEHNLIQSPEIIQRVRRALGLKQAHILPAMREGLQPVIIVEDLSQRHTGREATRHGFAGVGMQAPGVSVLKFSIGSSATTVNRRIYRVRGFVVSCDQTARSGTVCGHRITTPAPTAFDVVAAKQYYAPDIAEANNVTHPTGMLAGVAAVAATPQTAQYCWQPSQLWYPVPEARLFPDMAFEVIVNDTIAGASWFISWDWIEEPLVGS